MKEYKVAKDGDEWCATSDDFVDLQSSDAGFGSDPTTAIAELLGIEKAREITRRKSTPENSACKIPLQRLVMLGWNDTKDGENPPSGTLCVVYFPIGENQLTGTSFGPSALAYWVDGGWKRADEPSPLRGFLGAVGPAYWRKFELNV